MKKITTFFKNSYKSDPLAFFSEISETLVLMVASAILSLTILNPATHIFIPLYLVGSILAVFSTYRRGSSAILLTAWFTIMNSWAFIQLFIL